MTDRFADRLARFTPEAGGLDCDALLFAAGRASASGIRRWKIVAGVLAVSQLCTIAILWPRVPASPPVIPGPPVVVRAVPRADDASVVAHRRLLDDPDDLPPTVGMDSLIPDEPPLRASSIRVALVN